MSLPASLVVIHTRTGQRILVGADVGEGLRIKWIEDRRAVYSFTDLTGSENSVWGEDISLIFDSTPASRKIEKEHDEEYARQSGYIPDDPPPYGGEED